MRRFGSTLVFLLLVAYVGIVFFHKNNVTTAREISAVAINTVIQTSTGFYLPANMWHSSSNYLRFGQPNSNYGNRCHLANDYGNYDGSALGKPVFAIADGTVSEAGTNVGSYGGDSPSRNGGAIIIRHKTSDGKEFYALYGHVNSLKVAKNDFVVAGQQIATIAQYYSGNTPLPHLHFGINFNGPDYTGYTPTSACNNYLGFVDPEPFLNSSSPAPHEFHGAGSLIQPTSNCYGCNKDEAMAQNTGKGMVSFQWVWNQSNCDYITISAQDLNGNDWRNSTTGKPLTVGIVAGDWSSRDTDKYYVATLPTSIGYPRSSYNVAGVLLPSGLVGAVKILAKCGVNSPIDAKVETSRNKKGVVMTDGSTWHGQGSIISQDTAPQIGFGKTQDIFPIGKPFEKGAASFQWQRSSRCEALSIKSDNGQQSIVRLGVKQWNGSQASVISYWINLPYVLDEGFGMPFQNGNYYAVTVASNNFISNGNNNINISCIDR